MSPMPIPSRTGRCVSVYNRSARQQNTDTLIEAHLPQVKWIAERIAARLPATVLLEDLISAGVIGLLDAVDKFDPARGVLFKTYAEVRIRGAILDSLRHLDWAPRSIRRQSREIESIYARLEATHGRPAEEEEVAAAMGVPLNEFQVLLGTIRSLTLTDFGDDDDPEDSHLAISRIPDDPAHSPLVVYEQTERKERLAQAIDNLPERERQVVALYYLEELTLKEIGAVLGITESRVCQIHTQAILHLRTTLNQTKDDPSGSRPVRPRGCQLR